MLGQIFFIVCSHPWQASLTSFVLNKRKRQPLPPLQGEDFFILVLRTRAGSQSESNQSREEVKARQSRARQSERKESKLEVVHQSEQQKTAPILERSGIWYIYFKFPFRSIKNSILSFILPLSCSESWWYSSNISISSLELLCCPPLSLVIPAI